MYIRRLRCGAHGCEDPLLFKHKVSGIQILKYSSTSDRYKYRWQVQVTGAGDKYQVSIIKVPVTLLPMVPAHRHKIQNKPGRLVPTNPEKHESEFDSVAASSPLICQPLA